MTENFVVYGSMAKGMVHWGRIAEFVRWCCDVTVQGTMYRQPSGFPVYCSEGSTAIAMELMQLEGPPVLFQLLDQLHGIHNINPELSLFHRRFVEVESVDKIKHTAGIYVINSTHLSNTAKKIDGGDWREDMRQNPPLLQQLSERQSTYVRRLGSAVGREVIPIDTQLCRELIKLGLIVDKGRRMALTKLGREVYNYMVP